MPDVDGECAAAAVALFYSFNLQVQYEATQLLSALLTQDPLEEPVLKQLVALLQPPKHVRLLQHTATCCRRCVYPLVPLHVSILPATPCNRRTTSRCRCTCRLLQRAASAISYRACPPTLTRTSTQTPTRTRTPTRTPTLALTLALT